MINVLTLYRCLFMRWMIYFCVYRNQQAEKASKDATASSAAASTNDATIAAAKVQTKDEARAAAIAAEKKLAGAIMCDAETKRRAERTRDDSTGRKFVFFETAPVKAKGIAGDVQAFIVGRGSHMSRSYTRHRMRRKDTPRTARHVTICFMLREATQLRVHPF